MEQFDLCPECGSTTIKFFEKFNRLTCLECGADINRIKKCVENQNIFLSYGHDENAPIVIQIKKDLEERGHKIWIDFSNIKVGEQWRTKISEGIKQSNLFFSFLSKHSTREPGVCLDELSIALGMRGCVIKTVLLENELDVKAPVSINHIQWCDMHDWKSHWDFFKNVPMDDGWYESRISEIFQVVESDSNLKFLGEIEELKLKLNPVLPDSRIGFLLQREFEGREWLAQDVNNWRLLDMKSRVLLLTGDPGVGKSSFVAWSAHFNKSNVIASHFIEYNKVESKSPKRIVKSIAFQVACHFEDYRKSLLNLADIDQLEEKNVNELFNYLLIDPLFFLIKGFDERYVVIVDALDEANDDSSDSLVDVVAQEAEKLPGWLTFVITSRPNPDILRRLTQLNPIQISTSDERNTRDLAVFLEHWLENRKIFVSRQNFVISKIIEAAEGNFLYLKNFCAAVEAGWINVTDTRSYPRGLAGMYFGYFKRQFPDIRHFEEHQLPLFELVVASFESLPHGVANKIIGWNKREKIQLFDSLKSLFRWQDGTIEPFHKSLKDWLSLSEMSGEYTVSASNGHNNLADCGWKIYQNAPEELENYFLAWLPSHLLEAKRYDKLVHILKDFDFMMQRCKNNLLEHLLDDYRILVDRLPLEKRSLLNTEKSFFKNKDHFLRQGHQDWPVYKILLQLAWEHAEKSSMSDAATKWILSGKCDWKWLRKEHRPKSISQNSCIKILDSPSRGLRCVSVSPCKAIVASGGEDGVIALWDLSSGRIIKQFVGHNAAVRSCPFTPSGDKIVSGSYDGTVRLWDIESGECLKEWKQHTDWVTCTSISPDGTLALSGSKDGTVRLWDLSSYRCRKTFKISESEIMAVSWFPDGNRFVCGVGAPGNTLSIWDIKNNQKSEVELSKHSAPVRSVDVSRCGQLIVSGSYDNNVIVWNANDYVPMRIFGKSKNSDFGHTEWVRGVSFTADSKFVVSVSNDKIINLWNIDLDKHEGIAQGHAGEIMGVTLVPDSPYILTCAAQNDNTIRMWDLSEFNNNQEFNGQIGAILAATMTKDGSLGATGSGHPKGSIEIWNFLNGERQQSIDQGLDWVTGLSFSSDGLYLVSGERNGRVQEWSLQQGSSVGFSKEHNNRVLCVAFSENNEFIATGGMDGKINLWRRNPLIKIAEISGMSDWVTCLAWDNKKTIAAGFNDGTVGMYGLTNNSIGELVKFQAHASPISSIVFSSSELLFLTNDGVVGCFELDTRVLGRKVHSGSYAKKNPELFKLLSPQETIDSFFLDYDKNKIRLNSSPPLYWYGENISRIYGGNKISVLEKKGSLNTLSSLEVVSEEETKDKINIDLNGAAENRQNLNNTSITPLTVLYSAYLLGLKLEQRKNFDDEKFIDVQRALHLSNEDREDVLSSVLQISSGTCLDFDSVEGARAKIRYALERRLLPLRGPLYQWLVGLVVGD